MIDLPAKISINEIYSYQYERLNDRACIKDALGHWIPYERFGDHWTCMGTFVYPEEKWKWFAKQDTELFT